MRFFVLTFIWTLVVCATGVYASPHPEITPAPQVIYFNNEKRQWGDLTSWFGSVLSDIEGFVTTVGGEALSIISEDGGKVYTLATSEGGVATSIGGHLFTIVENELISIFEEVTSEFGKELTVLSTSGGSPFTLAESGVTTTLGTSVFVVATGGIATKNAGTPLKPYVPTPMLISLAVVLAGVVGGAFSVM